jgi:uncharacterized protein (DUF1778 family)
MATAEANMQIRLKNADKERIKRSADLSGVKASQFVLRAALKEADHIEASQKSFALNGDQFGAFLEALDSTPTPNKALHKLLHTAAPWD